MFKKDPKVCIEATIANYYGYFYIPDEITGILLEYIQIIYDEDGVLNTIKNQFNIDNFRYMEYASNYEDKINSYIKSMNINFHHPDGLSMARKFYDAISFIGLKFPIRLILNRAAIFDLMILILLGFNIKNKRLNGIILLIPAMLIIAVCLVGPTNGYYGRYTFPLKIKFTIFLTSTFPVL